MATVIDSFVVTLSLDPSKFTKGQREAYEAAKRLEEQQDKSAKNIEHGAGKAASALGAVKTQALGMLAVLTGGAGVLAFGASINNADAQVGRLSRNLGVSVSTLSKWQGVARIFGGDAQAMAQSFTTISDAFAGWRVGVATPLIADLRAISSAGGTIIDVNKGVEQSYLDLAENLRAINAHDPDLAGFLGRKVGLDPGLFDAMISGNLPRVLEMVRALGGATKESADNAGLLEQNWNKMRLSAEGLGRVILNKLNIAGFLGDMAEIFEGFSHGALLEGSLAAKTFGFAKKYTPEASGRINSNLGSPTTGGAFGTAVEKEQFIRSEAAKRGINPNVAMEVAKNEGFFSFVSKIPGETSYGAFQLHVTPGGKGGHLGDQFQKATGLDPSKPENERAGILFSLDSVKQGGWTPFHGARDHNISQWQGIDRNNVGSASTGADRNSGGPPLPPNLQGIDRGGSSSTTNATEVYIDTINVTAPAGSDPKQFASAFGDALKRHGVASLANSGSQ